MLKLGNKDIVGIYHGSDGVSYVYLGNTLVYSKEAPPQAPCFEVVDNITAYTANSYTDVYDLATSKWYKLNNLNQYEEYGLYGSGRTISYYVGKLTIDDGNEYEWDGTGWTDLGEVSGTSITIKSPEYLERSANANGYMPLGEFFQENTTIELDFQMTQAKGSAVIGDYGSNDNDDWRVFINYDRTVNNKVNYDFINTRVDWNSGDWSQRFNFEIGNYYIKNLNTGTNVITTTAKTGFTRPNQMYLFHMEGSQISNNIDYGHIYSTKIKQNGVLAKDYIPWTDENGNYGFFDKVGMEVHYSVGQMTGSSTVYDVTITGGTSYPKYYTQKSAPDNNLVFTDMAEAEAYQCPWVGMLATIGGLLYEYTDNGWSQLPFTITGVTKSSSNFTMKINGVDETAIIYADNGNNTYNYGIVYTNPITGITCSENSNIMTIDYSSATTTGWTSIDSSAFYNCSSLTSIVIPSGVTSIRSMAFYGCSGITSINIPSGVTTIENYTFYGCSGLTSVTIPSGVTRINNHVFENCSNLTSINIPSRVTTIGEYALASCTSLTSIDIPSGVTWIGSKAFDHCTNLTNVTIPSGLTSLGTSAFCECHAAFTNGVVIPSAITSIPDSAFFGCNALTSVALHSGITNVSNQAFGYCNLTGALDIPDSVTTIGEYAFRTNNNHLASVTIGSGVTSIGFRAFWQCRQLTGITVNATTPPTLGEDAFTDTNNCPIYVPSGSVTDYQTTWSAYASRIQAIPTPPHDYSQDYLTFRALEDGVFDSTNMNILCSKDNGATWTEMSSVNVNSGDTVMCKANGITPTSSAGIGTFSSTGRFEAEGNIMSLVSGDSFTQATTIANYQFLGLFSGCTGLTSAENMVIPLDYMSVSACTRMFWDCSNLTAAPALPATTLASTCYGWMFRGCSSLTTAPALHATTLAQSCYQAMFSNATGLTTPPELPATTLSPQCYQGMFYNTSITRAPELPATTLASACYAYMFQNCRNLNYIKALFTTKPSTTYTNSWVDGVSSTGTFVKNSVATWNVTGVNGIPNGWTVETASA